MPLPPPNGQYPPLLHRLTLLALLLLSWVPRPGAAQPTRSYASQVVASLNATNPTLATGDNLATQATLTPSLLLGAAAVRLGFPSMNPAGSKAGLVINTGGGLTLLALGGLVINTYLAPSTTPQETIQLAQLLTLQAANSGPVAAEFLTSKPFDQVELVAGGLLNAYTLGLVVAYAERAAPLPVELVAFHGKATATGTQLSWQTASEVHHAYFAIERATARDATFTELGRVAGGGATAGRQDYQFTDTQPAPLAYYRLRQVATDGQRHYSPVVVVQQRVGEVAKVVAYPNPASSQLMIACPTEVHLSLLNSHGQLLQQMRLAAGQQSFDVSQLAAGIYYLQDAATGQSTRFVKVEGQ
jgi:hypothetical protein